MEEKKTKFKKYLLRGIICKESNRKTAGITLIALVITVVVLIILATVAINLTLGNNGIFNRAKEAKEEYLNAQDKEKTEIAKATNEVDSYIDGNRDVGLSDEIKQYIDSKCNFATSKWVYTCSAAYTANFVSAGNLYLSNSTIFNTENSVDNYATVSKRDSDGYLKINKSGFYVVTMSDSMSGVLSNTGSIEIYDSSKTKINTMTVFIDYTHTTNYYNNTNGSVTIYLEKDNYIRPYFYMENATATKSFYAGVALYKCFD